VCVCHQGEEHLNPFIVKGLSDAELYSLALCNEMRCIYDAKFEEKSPSPSSLCRRQFSSHHLNSSNSLGVCVCNSLILSYLINLANHVKDETELMNSK